MQALLEKTCSLCISSSNSSYRTDMMDYHKFFRTTRRFGKEQYACDLNRQDIHK